MWDLSCPDWQDRIREGRSLIPDLPLFEAEADLGLHFFDELRLPDVIGLPLFRDSVGEWFRDLVRTVFGSRNPETNERMIREVFALVPKGSSKTTYSAGLMITAMNMNRKPRAEMLLVGPTQAISLRAFNQVLGMIEADPALKARFHPVVHLKEIHDLTNKSVLRVKTFALDILTGSMPVLVLLDEIHLLGRSTYAAQVIRQIRGGLEKNTDGLFIIITTQSDAVPAGVFLDELMTARKIRDGGFKGQKVRSMLPVLYEFPDDIACDQSKWENPAVWHMVMPNLGLSMRLDSLERDWLTEKDKGIKDIRVWASQHLNIQIGLGLKSDGWVGAEFWEQAGKDYITLDYLLDECEVVVACGDGGGMDDLFGFGMIGRHRVTKDWLFWSRSFCHEKVFERRKSIAPILRDFQTSGHLFVSEDLLASMDEMVAVIDRANQKGILSAVALDGEGPFGQFVEALAKIGITEDSDGAKLLGAKQGVWMMGAIKTSENKLANGTLKHSIDPCMSWCVSNLKIEAMATGIRATKANAGDAKIDPAIAMFVGVMAMIRYPEAPGGSYLDEDDLIFV
jgi:phage terminase large subunit-like protein